MLNRSKLEERKSGRMYIYIWRFDKRRKEKTKEVKIGG
jgi:hypothetical protein